ncbi:MULTISPECIES: glycosyltransferase family 1 protein [unclassified Cryobacterium]|jgi:phosphatidylinositol alpha 1,6-mannosyltransferase|uniref:glycosyltransferase family 4 protein n=1 Tax=unclassified Cryobacterium TaxID=2649013 RepID=UPI002AB332D1|nr:MULTISPECIES: glycosyltransferase family 1 protein [unclassified Cryobacterium]MDY7542737.1 glycosyltransferase family 1 protein [Cryobacterium sp. 5B3]MEB0264890.1 glycosyltransferase family 1 protein [Cryobacterium sp. 10I5]MEB0274786.1 glycosyltransferase family 1 protein [Cryobacterium sp. 5B3]
MRVAVVSESFLPTVSGVTTSVCKVLEHLQRTGHEAIVIAPAGAPAEYAGFPVFSVPAVSYRQFPVGMPSPHVQRLLADFGPDVVHAASPFLLGAQGIASANRLDIPSVAIFQTDVAGYARRNRLGQATKVAWRLVKWIHDGADLTLVPSSASMADLERVGVRRLARWTRGVDLVGYHPNRRSEPAVAELRKRLAPNGEVVIGYVGRMAPEKQVERFRALRGIPGIRVALVGDGPSVPLIQRELAGVPVTWLGRLSGSALADAYAAFDVFLHAGTEETFGQTIQEAHAAGLPVVAPHAGGPIDLVAHGDNGFLFAPDDERDLRRCVTRLVDDAPLRLRMGESGRRAVLGRSWENVCETLVGYYDKVIDERAAIRVMTAVPLSMQR